jgi:SAM-dependent methyltransferase
MAVSVWKRMAYGTLRIAVHSVGRSSDGILLCLDEGLTSGRMLDYIYRNEASGRWLVGRPIDRFFLSQPGWQSIRMRRANLEELLAGAIARLGAIGRGAVVLDVASGPASYILSVFERLGDPAARALCRDLDPRWVAQGRSEAARRKLANVAFEVGDALDREGILGVRPRPNVAVSSGFYDWIVDDLMVRNSMAIIHDALAPGGYFVSTNQAGHADLELVERVFTDFRHAPLRMTVRAPEVMEEWLRRLGFDIEETRVDRYGFYSVTLARKPDSAPGG